MTEEKIVRIEKIVTGGKGLSRDAGQILFVPYTLPGEKVRVRITRVHKDYLEGEPVEIIEPSPDRVSPQCRYFGICGGCQLSHGTYESQVRIKETILRENFQRNHLGIPSLEIITGPPLGYRHRAQFKVLSGKVGFYKMDTNQIVDIQECLCLTPGLNQLLLRTRKALAAMPVNKITEIQVYENDRGETAAFLNAPVPQPVRKAIDTRVYDPEDREKSDLVLSFRDLHFPMRPDIFLQVNAYLWKTMIHQVESHHQPGNCIAVEYYCGIGFFTLPLAPRFQKIYACEENSTAIRYAKNNYPLPNVAWVHQKAEKFPVPDDATIALVDPPRSGLHKRVVENLLKRPLDKITYISCEASSLARDCKQLSKMYRIERITLIDLFPQTSHFETIVSLIPKDQPGISEI